MSGRSRGWFRLTRTTWMVLVEGIVHYVNGTALSDVRVTV